MRRADVADLHAQASKLRATIDPVMAGIEAALVASTLGLALTLIAFAPLGARALPFSLRAITIGLLFGGFATVVAGRLPRYISGPTASGVLVIATLVRELLDDPSIRDDPGVAIVGAAAAILVAGLAQLGFARLRFGNALKFVPYPVLMGFANTVALLLIVSVLPTAFGHEYPGRAIDALHWFDGGRPASLVIAAVATLTGLSLARWVPRAPAALVTLIVATLLYHFASAFCARCSLGPVLDLASAAEPLGPHRSSFASALRAGFPFWTAVLQTGIVLAVLNALFSLLGAAQIAQARDPLVDGNRLLRSLGVGNVVSACLLGLPVAGIATATLAIRRASSRPWLAMATYLGSVVLVLSIGGRWFVDVPMVAIASAVFVSSRNLFDKATLPLLRQSMRRTTLGRATRGPLAVAALVIVVGLLRGLPSALFAGALATACLLAIEMRRSVVIAVHDARSHRSRRVRPDTEALRLDAAGDQVRIVELGHWLYFGTADALVDVLEAAPGVRWLVLDFRRVAGIDLTAARSLVRAAERLADRGVCLMATGLATGDERREAIDALREHHDDLPLTFVGTLDEALEQVEDGILGASSEPVESRSVSLPGLSPVQDGRLEAWIDAVTIEAGRTLFEAADAGDSLFSIRSGRLTLWIERAAGRRHRLLTFGAHGVFGELALLDHRPRSATAIADTDCSLWRLTRERLDAMALTDPALHAAVLKGIALHLARRLRDTTRLLDLD